jgi:hypothetical protein
VVVTMVVVMALLVCWLCCFAGKNEMRVRVRVRVVVIYGFGFFGIAIAVTSPALVATRQLQLRC